MKTVLNDYDEATGKTVQSVEWVSSELSVLFTDGTALVLHGQYTDEMCQDWEADITLVDMHNAIALSPEVKYLLGLVDAAERDELRVTIERLKAEGELQRKRDQLKRLKAELGEV